MNVRHIANLSSLVMGMVGSLYLSYDLFGSKRGILRRAIVGITFGVISFMLEFLIFYTVFLVATGSNLLIDSLILASGGGIVAFVAGVYIGDGDRPKRGWRGIWRPQKTELVTYLILVLCYLGVSTGIGIFSQSLKMGSLVFIFFMLLLVLFRFFIPLIDIAAYWAFKTDQKRLGAFGALLAGIAFAMQFWLAL